jgi:hypothetical protein
MAQLFKMEVLGYRNVSGRFTRRTEALQQAKRDEMRNLGRAGVATIRHYAPKRSGKFAEGIRYRTDERGSSTTLTFFASGEHAFVLPFLTEGTRPHPIDPHGDYPLRFFWKRGPRGPGIYHYMHVEHPGTLPDPFMERAIDAMSPQMDMALSRIGRRVIWLSE